MDKQVGPQIITAKNVFQFFKADKRSFFIVWSDGSVDRICLPDSMPSSSRLAFCLAVTAKRVGKQNLRRILNKYITKETPLEVNYIVNVAKPTKKTYEEDSDPVTLSRIERIEIKKENKNNIRTEIYWKSEDGNTEESHARYGSYEKHKYSSTIGVCYSILKHINSNLMFGSWIDNLPD